MVRNSLWPQFWLLRFFKVTIQLTQMFFDSPDLHVPVLPEIEGMCDSHEPATRQMQCWQIPPLQFLAAHPGLQCIAWGKALSRTVILGQALTVGTDLVSQMTVQNKPCSHESLSMPMSPERYLSPRNRRQHRRHFLMLSHWHGQQNLPLYKL